MGVLVENILGLENDMTTRAIFCQIRFWFKPKKDGTLKKLIHRDGQRWIAKSVGQWAEELDLTPWQVRKSIDKLKKLGFITVKTYKFMGTPTSHIRINVDPSCGAPANQLEHPLKSYRRDLQRDLSRIRSVKHAIKPDSGNEKTKEIEEGDSSPEYRAEEGGGAPAPSKYVNIATNCTKIESVTYPETVVSKPIKSSAEILKALKEHKNPNPSFYVQWMRKVADKDYGMQGEWTIKQRSIAKRADTVLGSSRTAVLDMVLGNWIPFCKYVEGVCGLYKTPSAPSIEFFAKHVVHALNYYNEHAAAKEKLAAVISEQSKVKVAPTPKQVEPEEPEELPSMDYILSLGEGLKL